MYSYNIKNPGGSNSQNLEYPVMAHRPVVMDAWQLPYQPGDVRYWRQDAPRGYVFSPQIKGYSWQQIPQRWHLVSPEDEGDNRMVYSRGGNLFSPQVQDYRWPQGVHGGHLVSSEVKDQSWSQDACGMYFSNPQVQGYRQRWIGHGRHIFKAEVLDCKLRQDAHGGHFYEVQVQVFGWPEDASGGYFYNVQVKRHSLMYDALVRGYGRRVDLVKYNNETNSHPGCANLCAAPKKSTNSASVSNGTFGEPVRAPIEVTQLRPCLCPDGKLRISGLGLRQAGIAACAEQPSVSMTSVQVETSCGNVGSSTGAFSSTASSAMVHVGVSQ
ncbi:uncharacterized protein LOC126184469 [Schistocerca cancellata]|uniref:uncharacterized protein LOC126184469 n=1 Tax=Schistocerca cancellata TaxID=274614 RepID=UPI00211901AA|nr:uncharacterized protein LOC126184469 [Schistocerca cancellata]